MSKAVLMSIRPKWCELIASGKKTVEIRRRKPNLEPPFKVYIYATWNGNSREILMRQGKTLFVADYRNNADRASGKVIGEFVCDEIFPIRVFENGSIQDYMWHRLERSCVPYDDISEYIGKDKTGYGLHISDLVIYDEPKELGEFYQIGKNTAHSYYDYCAGCVHHETPVGEYPCCECDGNRNYLYSPPQSFCYVEEGGTR